MSNYVRLKPEDRKKIILTAAVKLANKDGLTSVTFDTVSGACQTDTSRHTVKHYFGTKTKLFIAILGDKNVSETVKKTGRTLELIK